MSERKAAIIVNKVIAAFNAEQIKATEAFDYINQVEGQIVVSEATACKINDFRNACNHSRVSLETRGRW